MSSLLGGLFGAARLADAQIGWMDAVGLRRASLVGNSMGCPVVVDAGVGYPEQVGRLALIAPTRQRGPWPGTPGGASPRCPTSASRSPRSSLRKGCSRCSS
jgi:pimeloyl-ACP methyl ester carboxylesterase